MTGNRDIIIAGDWVVDEYWYLVRQFSDISSHTGPAYYRVSNKPTDQVFDLCSAGHVARVLFALRTKEKEKDYTIWGIGDWDKNDTEHLEHLIHTGNPGVTCAASYGNFSLSRAFCDDPPPGIKLLPLQKSARTTRVIRLYRATASGIAQLNRVDWDYAGDDRSIEFKGLPKQLPKSGDVETIVIHDVCKGAVTPELVNALRNRYENANWYVRTKNPNPSWLKSIKDRIAVFIVGPEIAGANNPWGSWISGKKITFHSYEYLKGEGSSATLVLSEEREVIGRINNGINCLTAKAPVPTGSFLQTGWPSALLAALVHILRNTPGNLTEDDIKTALTSAQEHVRMPALGSRIDSLGSDEPVVHIEPWQRQQDEWTSAMTKKGIIKRDGSAMLEVWRGASDLPGYVACVDSKRQAIIDIGKRLRAFTGNDEPSRSLSILLQADPGSGKTHLAKLLAQKFDLLLQSFDVTTMVHRDDLLDLFDAIATAQSNNPERRTLVFVDEINATLDAAGVYTAFLSPLEQGTYVRRGRVFSLRPCVWIFAGTDSEAEKKPKSEKISDFEQRLTTTVKLDFKSLISDKDQNALHKITNLAKLEQVYLGASMIRRRFPDVDKVSNRLLKFFYDFEPSESPARKIRKHVDDIRNVQQGVVTMQNMMNVADDTKLVTLIGNV